MSGTPEAMPPLKVRHRTIAWTGAKRRRPRH